jgi:site-specific recombinase XerD
MKITDVFKEFINYSLLERCLEPATTRWYENVIKTFYKYLRYKVLPATIDVITTENLRDHLVSLRLLGNSPRTLLNNMQALKAFCTYLVKKNYLPKNPFDGLEKPKLKRTLPEFLNEEEARELLKAAIDLKLYYKSARMRNIAIVALFLFTGIRRKELLNLKLQDLNLERGYIKVSAKNKERIVPLNETAKGFLEDYLKLRPYRTIDNVFVSTSKRDSALTEQGLNDIFRDLRKKVKFQKQISPQILRHTFCTLMLRNGINLRDIQLLAGHSDISTTARFYLGCDDKQLKQAVDRHPLNI